MSMYKWILKHTTVKWIAKIDDDVYVRIPETQRWLSTILPHMTRIGISSPFIKVFRSGQYAEDKYLMINILKTRTLHICWVVLDKIIS